MMEAENFESDPDNEFRFLKTGNWSSKLIKFNINVDKRLIVTHFKQLYSHC
jgi:hypothetical protein